jgi:hypothetical protein
MGEPIAEMDWKGKELGPYHLLYFDEISDNVIPTSTAADLEPLHTLVNSLYRKSANQAQRHKEITVYTPSGADDARRVKNSADGDLISVTNPNEVNTLQFGGISSNNHGFMLNSMELFDRMAGNLQAMLGLGAQTGTVGQETLIHGSASRREGHLQTMVFQATGKLFSDLGYLLWIDEFTTLPARVELENVPDISYDATWKPGDREGEFGDYDLLLDVYSMQYQGPGSRVRAINELLATIYIPMMPIIQQQGGTIDFAALAEMHSELMNLPRFKNVVMFNAPPVEQPASNDGAKKAPTSNRNYTRTNVSGSSSGVPDAKAWMGSDNKKGET